MSGSEPGPLAKFAAAASAYASASARERQAKPARLHELPILIIEDDLEAQCHLSETLRAAGFSQVWAESDPSAAIDQATEQRPALILLALQMEPVSGFSVLQLLQQTESLRTVPVIALTAAGDPETRLRALELGATEFLATPVDSSELRLRVRHMLSQQLKPQADAGRDPITGLPKLDSLVARMDVAVRQAVIGKSALAVLHVAVHGCPVTGPAPLHRSLADAGRAGDENAAGAAGGAAVACRAAADPALLASRLARRLKGCLRREDEDSRGERPDLAPLCRLDNGHFLVLLAHIRCPDDAARIARRLLSQLARPLALGEQQHTVQASVGISVLPDDGASAQMLCAHAASAAERAAAMGDGAYRFYSPELNQTALEWLKLQADLQGALQRGEMRTVYQPKIDFETGRVAGAEALLRWRHPEIGPIGPDRFIPVATECGLIIELGGWMIDQVCAQMARWRAAGLPRWPMSINISRQELMAGSLIDHVKTAMHQYQIEPGELVFELTESVLIERNEAVRAQVRFLRQLGVELSVDDFGTGDSSMGYVKRTPLDEMKIDRCFVMGLPQDKTDLAIVRAMVLLAHKLGMRVVAEGIEDAQQLNALSSLGIDQVQGYLLARPLSADGFAAFATSYKLAPALQTAPASAVKGTEAA